MPAAAHADLAPVAAGAAFLLLAALLLWRRWRKR
jgi:LPXTG-motif cell wall-anchored protein